MNVTTSRKVVGRNGPTEPRTARPNPIPLEQVETTQVTWAIPIELHDELQAWAGLNEVSIEAQAIHMLEYALGRRQTQKRLQTNNGSDATIK
jgi:hypothetical protein